MLRGKRANSPRGNTAYRLVPNLPALPGVSQLVEELSLGGPALVGLRGREGEGGHVVLAFAARYSRAAVKSSSGWNPFASLASSFTGGKLPVDAPDSRYYVREIDIVDPADGKVRRISGVEVNDVIFTAGMATAKAFIKARVHTMARASWESDSDAWSQTTTYELEQPR